jgi:hypothetical protein
MPLTPAGIIAALTPNLAATGNLGVSVPKLAAGVAAGIALWNPTVRVTTLDAGTLGAGTGVLPCLLPQPLLLGGFTAGMASFGIAGIFAASLALGLANGLAQAYPQGLISTINPTVGVGTGVAKFVGPSAMSAMNQGFSSAGLVGPESVKIANAIGFGLSQAFAGFTVPIPIVGPPSTVGSSGSGSGTIV